MKRFFFFVILVSVFCLLCTAQTPPPPPPTPPLIYALPETAEIKEFVFDECGYAISFAGSVDVPNRKDGCAGLAVRRKGSLTAFRMIRFSEDDLVKHPPSEVFSRLKEVYSDHSKLTLIAEKDISVTGIEGKEFSFSDKIRYRRVRALLKDRVLYDLYIDVTNWHILNSQYPQIAAGFEREANRFFDSFRLLPR